MSKPTPPTNATSALVQALAALDNVKANKSNPAFKGSRYVSLDALLEAVKPVLNDYGLALYQSFVREEGKDGKSDKVGINTAIIHTSGERFDFGSLLVKAEGLTAQQIGGAITYIRRQSIQTACGISVDLDDDGAVASGFRATPSQAAAPAFSPTPRPLTK
jgi:hypothetical protein